MPERTYTYQEYIDTFCGGVDSSIRYVIVDEWGSEQQFYPTLDQAERDLLCWPFCEGHSIKKVRISYADQPQEKRDA